MKTTLKQKIIACTLAMVLPLAITPTFACAEGAQASEEPTSAITETAAVAADESEATEAAPEEAVSEEATSEEAVESEPAEVAEEPAVADEPAAENETDATAETAVSEEPAVEGKATTAPAGNFKVTYLPGMAEGDPIMEVSENAKIIYLNDRGDFRPPLGFALSGWVREDDGAFFPVGIEYFHDSDVVFIAQWERVLADVTIHYNANGGALPSGAIDGPECYHNDLEGNNIQIAGADMFTRDGYEFIGWNTAADGSGQAYAADAPYVVGNTDAEFFAIWKAVDTPVVGNEDEGDDDADDPTPSEDTDKPVVEVEANDTAEATDSTTEAAPVETAASETTTTGVVDTADNTATVAGLAGMGAVIAALAAAAALRRRNSDNS